MTNTPPRRATNHADPGYLAGTDLSHWQATVDWSKMEAGGIAYAWLKASDGAGRDALFASRWTEIRRTKIFGGAYHFLRPHPSGADQAAIFLKQMGTLGAKNLPPMVDIEWAPHGKVTDQWHGLKPTAIVPILTDWLDAVEKGSGRTPVIYTHPFWWDPAMGQAEFGRYPLWLSFFKSVPKLPHGWKKWTFWQWTDRGDVPGVGKVDRNRFLGTPADLQQFIAASIISTNSQ